MKSKSLILLLKLVGDEDLDWNPTSWKRCWKVLEVEEVLILLLEFGRLNIG